MIADPKSPDFRCFFLPPPPAARILHGADAELDVLMAFLEGAAQYRCTVQVGAARVV